MSVLRWVFLIVAAPVVSGVVLSLFSGFYDEAAAQTVNTNDAAAQPLNCAATAVALSHRYPSGARWSACAELNPVFGLRLSELHYQIPDGAPRQTFSELHLAGLLEHHHDELRERSVLSEAGFGTDRIIPFDQASCAGDIVSLPEHSDALCTVAYADRILAKFDNESVVQNHSWDIISSVSDGRDVWEVIVTLSEEGSVIPSIHRSGVVHRFTTDQRFGSPASWQGTGQYAVNATVLATWRLVPGFEESSDISSNEYTVEQLDFSLRPDLGDRRPMRTTPLATETFRQVSRDQFRRWRVFASDGAGYMIDVQNNGFQFRSRQYNFALFDFALSAYNACELTVLNDTVNTNNSNCGRSLDDYVNGETLTNRRPVIWFSQSMPITVGSEDQPLMQTRALSFALTPFDWTKASPFAPAADSL